MEREAIQKLWKEVLASVGKDRIRIVKRRDF
jgi:hypothetical protein